MTEDDPLNDPLDAVFGSPRLNPSGRREALEQAVEESELDIGAEEVGTAWMEAGVSGDYRESQAFEAMVDEFLNLHTGERRARVYTKPGELEASGYDVYWHSLTSSGDRWQPTGDGVSQVPAGLIPTDNTPPESPAHVEYPDGGCLRSLDPRAVPDVLEDVFNQLIPLQLPFHILVTPEGSEGYRVEYQLLQPVEHEPHRYEYQPARLD